MSGDALDRIGAERTIVKIERLRALEAVARAAQALQETEWIAFIGWQPSADREQAIGSSCASLNEALARLDGAR